MFMVLSSWPWSLCEFTRFIWWMQTERWMAANPQTKPSNLGCESADKWLLPSTSTIAICYYYSAQKLSKTVNYGSFCCHWRGVLSGLWGCRCAASYSKDDDPLRWPVVHSVRQWNCFRQTQTVSMSRRLQLDSVFFSASNDSASFTVLPRVMK